MDAVRIVLQNNADISATDMVRVKRYYCCAMCFHPYHCCYAIFTNVMPFRERTQKGRTALHAAASLGYANIISALLERFSDLSVVLDAKEKRCGYTALHCAALGNVHIFFASCPVSSSAVPVNILYFDCVACASGVSFTRMRSQSRRFKQRT